MNRPFVSLKQSLAVAALVLPVAFTTGCSMGTTAAGVSNSVALQGVLHGGPNPVKNASVNLYATASNGYGGAGSLLKSTNTDSNGNFSFTASSYTCPAGQQAYITATGGDSGSGTNNNILLMAALGPCTTLNANSVIRINEATTVAAAYALSGFTTVTGTGPNFTVNVSAPASNNAITPSCTGTGSSQTCTTAGLAHAFLNAANLVSALGTSTAPPTGGAYPVAPTNPSSLVPNALINTIANYLQSCVNSTGGSASDTSTSCGMLFSLTTPPTTSTTTGVTPTSTLQAALNMAQFPTLTPAAVTSLFSLQNSASFFLPELSAAPTDYSLAIMWKGVTISGTTTPFTYPFFLTLDYNDNVYSVNQASSSGGPTSPAALASNGASLWQGAAVSSGTCAAAQACVSSTDASGHLWVPDASTTLNEYSTADGTLTATFTLAGTTPYATAVDKYNNVYLSNAVASANSIYQKTAAGSSFAALNAGSSAASFTVPGEYLSFDQSGNLWASLYASASTATGYLTNSGAGTFSAQTQVTDSSTAGSIYGTVIDGSGNAWTNNTKTLYKVAAGSTSASAPAQTSTISFVNGATTTAASSARYPALDGVGNIFIPDNNTTKSYLWTYYAATGNFVFLSPCGNASTTGSASVACSTSPTSGLPLYGNRNAQADSTGSIWIASSTNGSLTQVLGVGAPTQPQLSYGKPGARP